MSTSGAGGPRIRRLFERAANAGSLGEVIFQGVGAVLLAIGTAIASGIVTIGDLFIVPAQAFIGAVAGFIDGLFGGAANILTAGAISTIQSILPGGMFNLGPLTFIAAIAIVAGGFYLIAQYLAQPETGNLFFGLPIDLPTPFFQDPEEDNEEE